MIPMKFRPFELDIAVQAIKTLTANPQEQEADDSNGVVTRVVQLQNVQLNMLGRSAGMCQSDMH